MKVKVKHECPVVRSFEVDQAIGMFDLSVDKKLTQEYCVEVPGPEEEWQIGLIVGPSGSGKSSVARVASGGKLQERHDWPKDTPVIGCFKGKSIRDITAMLTAVGFSSPPDWLKPYRCLSNGQQHRCDLAYALLMTDDEVIFIDEFSSVVDRVVARVMSAAVAKSIRKGHIKKRVVLVTCHPDVAEWLEPDWVLDMATQTLARGSLRRPAIRLEVVRCDREAWRLFKKHHYLSEDLHQSAQCYLATWEGHPVAFCAVLHTFGWKNSLHIHRVVTLPDYQGIGIGTRFAAAVAKLYPKDRMTITTSHPGIIRAFDRSPEWRLMRVEKGGSSRHSGAARAGNPRTGSTGRTVVAFEFRRP